MLTIKAICLDLDDTLWDLVPALLRAEASVDQLLKREYPRTAARYSIETLRSLRARIAAENTDRGHDLAYLRRETYRQVQLREGLPEEFVEQAYSVFQAARNCVDLYDDVVPFLERASAGHRLFALSNGTADLKEIGLDRFFDGAFSARDLGFAKPDLRVFNTLVSRSRIRAGDFLHVGDDPANDIVGPAAAGMNTVWLNRKNKSWPPGMGPADFECGGLGELADWLAL